MRKLKYIKTFEAIISPKNIDGLIDELINNTPNTLEEANEIGQKYDVDIVDRPTFVESVKSEKEFSKSIPSRFIFTPFSGLYFGVLNPVTKRVSLVVDYKEFKRFLMLIRSDRNLSMFDGIMKSMLSHETIHKQQLDKVGGDFKKYDLKGSPETDPIKYLSSTTEIMAYAFSIVDELKRQGLSEDEILNVLRKFDDKAHWVIKWYKSMVRDKKVLNKLRKYAYQYTKKLMNENEEDN